MTPSVAACDAQAVEKAFFVTVSQDGQPEAPGSGEGAPLPVLSPSLTLPGISSVNHCAEPRKLSLRTKAQDLGAASPPVLKQPDCSHLVYIKEGKLRLRQEGPCPEQFENEN